MKKIVIDACVAIDLNIPKVNFLEQLLSCLGDECIFISSINFNEIHDLKTRRLLQNSEHVAIIEDDDAKFIDFSSELESLRLNLSNPDRHVLFLANELNADFAVSSDLNVIDKVTKYRIIKKLDFMRPQTTVLLIDYLYQSGKIRYNEFFEVSLNLFKYKEIDNMLHHLSEENLNIPKPEQLRIINDYKRSVRERFQIYKDPLVDEFRQLLSLGRIQA